MKSPLVWFVAAALMVVPAWSQEHNASFNLSTNQSFAPGEQPKIHLYTHNVDALEFRVYRVNDPVKFVENLKDLHSFGPEAGLLPPEQIDERTWIEKFHDWKNGLWDDIRDFFKYQFSHAARTSLERRQSAIEHRSRIVSEAEFAQIPILNSRQLVARWRQLVPSTFISDNNVLPVPKLTAGLYLLEATDGHHKAYTLVMVTQMVLVTRTTSGKVTSFVVDRNSGDPLPGVTVEDGLGQKLLNTATTDASGVADLAATGNFSGSDNFWVVAHKGNEVALSTPSTWSLTYSNNNQYAGYVFAERPVYRPTHTVHWKAILREHDGNSLVLPKTRSIRVTISDESDKAVFQKDMPVSVDGDVAGDFDLPKDAALGYYSIRVGDSDEGSLSGGFHVEDYRKPEYRVQVSASTPRVLQGATMPVTIDSRYFFGEPVANASVKYRVYHDRHYWWGEDEGDSSDSSADTDASDAYNGDEESEQTGKLDANGKLVIQVPTHADAQGHEHNDLDYTVEAGVTDAANREITGRGRFLATYSTFRINIEPLSYSVHPNELAKFRVTAIDYDNKPVSTHVHVQLVFRHWHDGRTDVIQGAGVDVNTDASGQATGAVPVGSPQYSSAQLEATASAVQPGTRDPGSDTFLWIMGINEADWESNGQAAQLISDKKTYAPGETAHLSLVSEVSGFSALTLVEGKTLQKRDVIRTDGKTVSFDVSITVDSQPNVTVSALFVKNGTLYQAQKVLKIPPVQQQLQIQIAPSKDVLQPQQSVSYDVTAKDASGKPVSADLSFGVVDEAIYSLYPDSSGDMIRALYPRRFVEAQVDSSLDFYFSGEAGPKSPMLAMRNARYRPQLAQVKPGNEAKPRVRKAFPDTAYWAASVHTDSSGHAHVSFAFPDSLTTWRTTVHAITADSKAGSSINRVLVRKDVLVRMGTPRFMISGDEITIPVIAHNYLDTAKQATISLAVEGLDIASGSKQSVVIPSKGEATALWRLRASHVGTAKLDASVITDAQSDALELTFPVQPAGVARTIANSGAVRSASSGATATINFPSQSDPASHSLHVEISPSIAGSLFSSLDYLISYPYGCTEQTMSSYLPNVIVAETLSQLKVNGHINQSDLQAKMQAGLDRLKDYQHDDGGWGWWKEDESRVYMTAYVVSGLGQGAQVVPQTPEQREMLRTGVNYLRNQLEQHPRMRPELRAAVVYALAEAGGGNLGGVLDEQWSRRNDLEPEALAMTGLAMLAVHDGRATQVASLLASKAVHAGDLVSWKGSYVPLLDVEYNNDVEATAYALRFLAKVDAKSPVLSSAAQWLMLQRNGGVWWDSTEQTAMVLFGLVDYLKATNELDTDETVEVMLNGSSLGKHHFNAVEAQSGATFSLDIDAAHLQAGNNTVQIIRRDGRGSIYWSTMGRYYSTTKRDYQSGSMSLNLTRDYYKLQPMQKDGKVMYSLQPFNGNAQIGDVLAVHEAIGGSPMRYLLLEDPIPAGTEFIANEDSYEIDHRPGGWYDWFTRREFHDDHAAFFSTDFSGRQEVFYLIRVVNPGTFQISPASVQPMYQNGVQATSDAFHLVVPAPAVQGGAQ